MVYNGTVQNQMWNLIFTFHPSLHLYISASLHLCTLPVIPGRRQNRSEEGHRSGTRQAGAINPHAEDTEIKQEERKDQANESSK